MDQYQIDVIQGEADLSGRETITVVTPDGPRQAAYWMPGMDVAYDGFFVRITGAATSTSPDQLIRIAENLRVAADPADRATWFDAQDALP